MSLPAINLVVLRCKDVDGSESFYDRIGLIFERHKHGNGLAHLACERNGIVFELYPATHKFPPSAGTRIGFRVDGLDQLVARLGEQDGTVLTSPQNSPWGRRAVVVDPDGRRIELTETEQAADGGGERCSAP